MVLPACPCPVTAGAADHPYPHPIPPCDQSTRPPPRPQVKLVVPWLPKEEQGFVFNAGVEFSTPAEQAREVMAQLRRRLDFALPPAPAFELVFYPGRYDHTFCSIIPKGDLTDFVPEEVRVGVGWWVGGWAKGGG